MSSWNTGDTVVNGVRLHYTRTGGKKPPLVLAHGFSDAGLCWTPVAQALEANYDLVMVDARGHGFSDAPETGYTLTEMTSDLQGVIASLGLVRPAIIGHSMGGGTTLALAGLYPNVPGAIILEDAGALNDADFPRRIGRRIDRRYREGVVVDREDLVPIVADNHLEGTHPDRYARDYSPLCGVNHL